MVHVLMPGRPYRDWDDWVDRFWARVDAPTWDGCWTWTANKSGEGYGRVVRFGAGRTVGSLALNTHRVAYELLVGPIPNGLQLDHLCRVRACCNPLHLEPVTPRENSRRGLSPAGANARKTHCKWGHPFSGHNLMVNAKGQRTCRECFNKARRERARATGPGFVLNAEKTHCKHGHEFTPENTYTVADGARRCRACQRDRQRRYAAERRSA